MARKSPPGRAGRAATGRRGSLRTFYLALGLLALLGLGAVFLRARALTQPAPSSATGGAVLATQSTSGRTPEGFYYKGSPDAPVTVVEYSDFQCPACAAYASQLAAGIDQRYVETGKVRFVYHDFPLPNHANAPAAAAASRCAGEQNAFWPMHDLLFTRQSAWAKERDPQRLFVSYADELKLDRGAFTGCLTSGRYATPLREAAAEATKLGIPGTPTFIVDGRQVDARELEAAIEDALRAKGR